MFKGFTGWSVRRVSLSRPLRTTPQASFDWDSLSRTVKERLPSLDIVRQRFPVKLPKPFWQNDAPEQTSQGLKAPPAPKHVVQDAAKSGSLGFGFSAGGMLFPYYLGVLEALTELDLINGTPRSLTPSTALGSSKPLMAFTASQCPSVICPASSSPGCVLQLALASLHQEQV